MADVNSDTVARWLRDGINDPHAFPGLLASRLEEAAPNRTKVKRKGGLLGGGKRVQQINVDLGEHRFRMEVQGARLECLRSSILREIVLKEEHMPLPQWIDGLSRDLVAESKETMRIRLALEKAIGP